MTGSFALLPYPSKTINRNAANCRAVKWLIRLAKEFSADDGAFQYSELTEEIEGFISFPEEYMAKDFYEHLEQYPYFTFKRKLHGKDITFNA